MIMCVILRPQAPIENQVKKHKTLTLNQLKTLKSMRWRKGGRERRSGRRS